MNNDRTLSTRRVLPFAPETIYSAFAKPEVLASWWGPDGFSNTFEVFDFRIGGRWIFTMHGPDGRNYANTSCFTSLDPGRSIVIRHDCQPFFTLTVSLSQVVGGTLLNWDQEFDDSGTASAVKAVVGNANEQNLDRLTKALAISESATYRNGPVSSNVSPPQS